jgi:hypothetical protein
MEKTSAAYLPIACTPLGPILAICKLGYENCLPILSRFPTRWRTSSSTTPSPVTWALGSRRAAEPDPNLRTSRRVLGVLVDRDTRPLSIRRDISNYFCGTSHDFALLATGRLREAGIPARLRCRLRRLLRPRQLGGSLDL